MKIDAKVPEDIMAGMAVSVVIVDPDDGKLGRLAGYLKGYVSDKVRSSMTIAPGTEGTSWQMTLHIPTIEEPKRTLVIQALEKFGLQINRQQDISKP